MAVRILLRDEEKELRKRKLIALFNERHAIGYI